MSSTVQEKKQERKAAKTLSFILLVFLITWTPYNVLAVMKAILGPEHEVIFKKLWQQMIGDLIHIENKLD